MRPVDKGDAPYIKISKYQEAEPYLEKENWSILLFL